MTERNFDSRLRFWLLLTALLLQALSAGYAVAWAEPALETTTVSAKAIDAVSASELRDSMRTGAQDAAARTRIKVATDLNARMLKDQRKSLRLASRNQGERG